MGCPAINDDYASTEVDVVRLVEVEEPVVVGISRLSDSDWRRSTQDAVVATLRVIIAKELLGAEVIDVKFFIVVHKSEMLIGIG